MSQDFQAATTPESLRSPTLRDVAAVFFRHKRLLVVSFALIATAGVLYSIFFPSYKAEMKVLLRRGRIDPAVTPTPSPSPAFEHDEIAEEELNSEVEMLHDEDILRQVVLETGLAGATWTSALTSQTPEERTEKAVRRLARKLEVRPVRKSRLITVSYSSSNAERSAAVLRSLSRIYLTKHAESARPSGQQTFFEQQIRESQLVLEQAQRALIAFTRKKRVVSAELERDLTLHKLSDAQASELGLESAIAEARERVHSLETRLRDLPERRVVAITNADNPQLQEKLKSKLLELELRRTELMTKFQPSYRLVQQIDQQIAQAKTAVETEELKPLRDETTRDDPEFEWAHSEHLKSEVELQALQQKEAVLHEQVLAYRIAAQTLEENAVAQHDLEQNMKTAEEKYLLYSNKREEARIGDALDQDGVLNVAIAEQPRVPDLPVWPLWAATCFSFIGAFGLSTGLAFATDYFDPSFRTPEEVVEFLGSPVLMTPSPRQRAPIQPGGLVSISAQLWRQITPGAGVSGRKPPIAADATARLGKVSDAPAFSLMHQLFFPSATLRRTSILFAAADAHSKASALCEQIAIALSKVSGEMVGIVEASSTLDRNPWMRKGMPSSFGRGLWQVYSSRLSERVWRIPPALLSNECRGSRESTCDGLKELRSTFKYFLFSASINESETPILCNLCEAAVLVLTANVTRRETALRAKEQLLRQGVTLLGTVLDRRTLPIPESIYQRL